jgi:hypothetical protein
MKSWVAERTKRFGMVREDILMDVKRMDSLIHSPGWWDSRPFVPYLL